MKTWTKFAAVGFVAGLAFAIGGCATYPQQPYQTSQYHQPQQRQVVMVQQPQMVVVQPQGIPTIAGGVIIPNAHDVCPGGHYRPDGLIVCPQPTIMVVPGRVYQATPYPPGYPCNSFMPCPGYGANQLASEIVRSTATLGGLAIIGAFGGFNQHRGYPPPPRPYYRR